MHESRYRRHRAIHFIRCHRQRPAGYYNVASWDCHRLERQIGSKRQGDGGRDRHSHTRSRPLRTNKATTPSSSSRVGVYNITVEQPGFQKITKTGIQLNINQIRPNRLHAGDRRSHADR